MSWDKIAGQEFAKTYLQGHLAAGRVANGYLLIGPDGAGKRRLAMEMAKALNCEATRQVVGGERNPERGREAESRDEALRPCDRCRTCLQMSKGTHPDLHVLVPEGPADRIKIESMRQVLGRIALRPYSAKAQVVIIDGAERLTEEAANALLKALEEPSPTTTFLLTTASVSQCLPTILSRCQLVRCPSRSQTSETSQWRQRLADPSPLPWLTQPLPDTREDVARLLDEMMLWLRDLAAQSVSVAHDAQPQPLLRRSEAPASQRRAPRAVTQPEGRVCLSTEVVAERQSPQRLQGVDPDRCADTALSLIELQESLEHFVSPRLVAAIAREKWLSLWDHA